MKLLLIVFGVLTLAGCTFQSNQLSALKAMWNKPSRSDVTWRARYGSAEVAVIAVTHEPFIVFVSDDDVAIAFDGWQVRAVAGFGLQQQLKIEYEAGNPQFSGSKSVSVGMNKHRCAPWEYSSTQTEGRWLQRCKADFFYENVIVIDTDGAIRQISQVVDASGTRLILEKT